jgi:hypothetical protein
MTDERGERTEVACEHVAFVTSVLALLVDRTLRRRVGQNELRDRRATQQFHHAPCVRVAATEAHQGAVGDRPGKMCSSQSTQPKITGAHLVTNVTINRPIATTLIHMKCARRTLATFLATIAYMCVIAFRTQQRRRRQHGQTFVTQHRCSLVGAERVRVGTLAYK